MSPSGITDTGACYRRELGSGAFLWGQGKDSHLSVSRVSAVLLSSLISLAIALQEEGLESPCDLLDRFYILSAHPGRQQVTFASLPTSALSSLIGVRPLFLVFLSSERGILPPLEV